MQRPEDLSLDRAVAAVIEGRERSFRARVTVDWGLLSGEDLTLNVLDPWLQEVNTERSLKGSAPEEILLVEGSSAAEMDLTLSGDYKGMSLVQLFSRYSTLSPLYGKRTVGASIKYSLIVDTPLGEWEVPQFVGEIRTINPDRADGTVQITALDLVEKLRKPMYLPTWAMYSIAVNWGETDSQVAWSHSIIDLCLRNCDVSPSPYRPTTRDEMNVPPESPDSVQFFLPGNGSYLPAVGWVDNPRASTWPNRGKPMFRANAPVHPAVAGEAQPNLGFAGVGITNFNPSPAGQNNRPVWEGAMRYWCSNRDRIPPQGTHYISFTLNNPAQAIQTGNATPSNQASLLFEIHLPWARVIRVYLFNNGIFVRRHRGSQDFIDSPTIAIPNTSSPAQVFIQLDQTAQSGSKLFMRVGSNSTNGWVTFGSPPTSYFEGQFYNILGRIQVCNIVDMSDVMYGARNMYNSPAGKTTDLYRTPGSPAVLDRGLNRFSHLPSIRGNEAWKIITDVAAAEFGSVFWDEKGVFRFWNQDTVVSKQQVPVKSLSLDYLANLNLTDTLDSVRNVFVIQAIKKRAVDTGSVYRSQEIGEFETQARTVNRVPIWVDNVISPITFQATRYQGYAGSVAALPVWNPSAPPNPGFVVQGYFNNDPADDDGWFEQNAQITVPSVTTYFDHEGQLVVRVDNGSNNVPIRLARGWGGGEANNPGRTATDATFNVGGTIVQEFPAQAFTVRNQSSINRYGVKVMELRGPWYQDSYAANNMVSTLMQRTANPIPVADDITVPGDPRIQLADTILLQDSDGFGSDIPVQILGIRRRWSDQGLSDTYTIEVLQPYEGGIPLPPPPEGVTIERTNFCENPRCQTNRDGWFSSRFESRQITGLTDFPGTTTGFAATDDVIMPRAKVIPGELYTFSAYVLPTFTGNINLSVDFYDGTRAANEQYLSSTGTRSVYVTANKLTRVAITVTVPPNATEAPFIARYGGNRDAVWSQVMYERVASVETYFDGSTFPPYTSWNGAVGNSTSHYLVQAGVTPPGGGNPGGGTDPGDPGDPEDGYTRRNLCVNPALANNTNEYFAPTAVTATRVTNLSGLFPRTTGLSISAAMPNQSAGVTAPLTTEVTPGETYTVSAYIRCDAQDSLDGKLQLHFKGASGAWIGASADTAFSIAPGEVQRVSVTVVVPAGTTNFNPFIYQTTKAYTVSGFLYEKADSLQAYFDGSSSNTGTDTYSWVGTPGNSPSQHIHGNGGDQTGPPPSNSQNTAAAARGWGNPVQWDTFNYTGSLRSDWSVYGVGGNEPHPVNGADGKVCWPGHDGNGRRCVENVELTGSYLRLRMDANGDQAGVSHRYNQQYGRWEVRARTLPKAGATGFPGHSVLIIWPQSDRWPQDGEYDFFEVNVGDTKAGAYMHYPHDPGTVQQIYAEQTGVDVSQWHNYAIEWTPEHIKLFIDGVQWGPTMSGGARTTPAPARRNIQDMPSGHLTMQIDNFNSNEVGMQEGYLDIEWVRIYDMSNGTGGGTTPQPTAPPTERTAWSYKELTNAAPTSYTLSNAVVGDTVFATVNTSGTPTIQGTGITWDAPIESGGPSNVRFYRGRVTQAGDLLVQISTTSSSGVSALGSYVGNVTIAAVSTDQDAGSYPLDIPGLAAPANSTVLANWSLVSVGSTWTGQIVPPSGWTTKAQGRFGSGTTASTRVGLTVAGRNYTTATNTGTATATTTATGTNNVGWGGVLVALVNG